MLVARSPAPKPSPMELAAFASMKSFSLGPGNSGAALKIVGEDKQAAAILTRTTQTISTSTGWSGKLPNNTLAEFLASLTPESAAARLIPQGMVLTFKPGTESLTVPIRGGAPVALPWRAEGDPLSVRQYSVDSSTRLSPKSFGGITIITREAAKRTDAQALFTALLREDIGASLDLAYFSATAVSASAAAGLLNGVSAIAGYGGGDETAMKTDLTALTNAIAAGGNGQVAFVVSPARAMKIPILYPDFQQTVLASTAVADDVIIGLDPTALAHAFGDEPPDIDVSDTALIHMSDTPAEIVAANGTTAAPVRSTWQTAALAVRVIGDAGFAKRRSNAVAWISGATW